MIDSLFHSTLTLVLMSLIVVAISFLIYGGYLGVKAMNVAAKISDGDYNRIQKSKDKQKED